MIRKPYLTWNEMTRLQQVVKAGCLRFQKDTDDERLVEMDLLEIGTDQRPRKEDNRSTVIVVRPSAYLHNFFLTTDGQVDTEKVVVRDPGDAIRPTIFKDQQAILSSIIQNEIDRMREVRRALVSQYVDTGSDASTSAMANMATLAVDIEKIDPDDLTKIRALEVDIDYHLEILAVIDEGCGYYQDMAAIRDRGEF